MTDKQMQVQEPVSMARASLDPHRSLTEASQLKSLANFGAKAPSSAFPYASRINSGFGRFAPVGTRAVFGPAARMASEMLHANAYAYGNLGVFPDMPSLETATHEAAHIAAGQRGVKVPGGVGSIGDAHEKVADEAARAVVAGRSAEPIFEEAYGDAPVISSGEPQLQMDNKIKSHVSTKKDTPWKQIKDQLLLNPFTYDIDSKLGALPGGFGAMVTALGDKCDRAESVKAELDGTRKGGVRASDATQTAYGNIGNFMSLATGTPTPHNEAFQGGHLVSDEILGTASYVQYNFAPQRSSLNSPHYRQIETLAAEGAVNGFGSKSAKWNYDVNLTYDKPNWNVPIGTIQTQLGIKDTDIQKSPKPANVNLTTWVPHLWEAELTAGFGEVFKGESRVDTNQGSGVGAGFGGTEAATKSKSTGVTPDTTKYLDTTYWSMDSMKFTDPYAASTVRTTGSALNRQNKHSWTGVQSPPRGQTAFKGASSTIIPPTTVPSVPSLSRAFSLSQGWLDSSNQPITVPVFGEAFGKESDRLTQELFSFSPGLSIPKTDMKFAIGVFNNQMRRRKAPKLKRKFLRDKVKAGKGSAAKKRKRSEAMEILLSNVSATTGGYLS